MADDTEQSGCRRRRIPFWLWLVLVLSILALIWAIIRAQGQMHERIIYLGMPVTHVVVPKSDRWNLTIEVTHVVSRQLLSVRRAEISEVEIFPDWIIDESDGRSGRWHGRNTCYRLEPLGGGRYRFMRLPIPGLSDAKELAPTVPVTVSLQNRSEALQWLRESVLSEAEGFDESELTGAADALLAVLNGEPPPDDLSGVEVHVTDMGAHLLEP